MTGQLNHLERVAASALRQRRKRLAARLPSIQEVLPGSLIERYKRCGNQGCKCVQGRGHGPKYYLSVSLAGSRPQMDYVPCERLREVLLCVRNYRQARDVLKGICAINWELLRRRERL